MNTTISSATTSSIDDLQRGYTVIHRAIDFLGFGIAVAATWSCSSIIMGLILGIVVGFFMYLLSYAAKMFVFLSVDQTKVERLGSVVNPSRITGWFKRAPAPTTASN